MSEMTNTWDDKAIVNDPRIPDRSLRLRAAAEFVHRNESLHRHEPSGVVCVYCALVAANALKAADEWDRTDPEGLSRG